MTPLASELKALSDAASFTMVDMATWIEYDKSAVREWMKHNVEPHPIKMRHIKNRLTLLREMLKEGTGLLPVPIQIKQYGRVKYVKRAREYALKKFSKLCVTE